MLQLVERNPLAVVGVTPHLIKDFDIRVAALAHRSEAKPTRSFGRLVEESLVLNAHDSNVQIGQRLFEQFGESVQEKLDAHTVMMELILPAIKFGGGEACSLSQLNQGLETAKAYLLSIAEYADVPVGKDVELLRRAATNMPSKKRIKAIVRKCLEQERGYY